NPAREGPNYGKREDKCQIVSKVIGVNKRTAGARSQSEKGFSPIIGHEKPENLPVPGKLLHHAKNGDEQPGTEDGQHNGTYETRFAFSLWPTTRRAKKRIEEHEKKEGSIGKELQ